MQAVLSQLVSFGTTETMINPDYAGLYRTMPDKVRQSLAERGFERVRPQSCRAVVTRPRNGLATVIWPIAALAGREWLGNRIETALFPEPFRGSESAVNPRRPCRRRNRPAGALQAPCICLASALQRACNRAARPTGAIGGQILWQVPNPIGSPLSRYPVRLPSASRAAGWIAAARRGCR